MARVARLQADNSDRCRHCFGGRPTMRCRISRLAVLGLIFEKGSGAAQESGPSRPGNVNFMHRNSMLVAQLLNDGRQQSQLHGV